MLEIGVRRVTFDMLGILLFNDLTELGVFLICWKS